MFDSSTLMAQAAMRGYGVAILPLTMFEDELQNGRLIQPFALTIRNGGYWLVKLKSRQATAAMTAFCDWLIAETQAAQT